MLSKAKAKYIKSLQVKKFRKLHHEFLVEGAKSVVELINSDFEISALYLTQNFQNCYKDFLSQKAVPFELCTEPELEQAGAFASNNAALAVAKIKSNTPLSVHSDEYGLVLDDVKDPGNLGTLIRIADWYGIQKIICSENTAELYNPKVISSSMGSFCRVQLYYTNLEDYFANPTLTVYGALLEGKNVHEVEFSKGGLILLGNESQGINDNLKKFIHKAISIPSYGGAESLNVAVAGAVICDNMRRNVNNL